MLSIPEITEAIAADFAARGITADVEFGTWKAEWNSGGDRVVVGLADFTLEPPGLPSAPGVHYIDDEETEGARPLFSRRQQIKIWVHGKPPGERDPKRSINAEKVTAALLHQVMRALYVVTHGSLVALRGTWPSTAGQPFVFGSLAIVTADVGIPVLDDVLQGVTPDAEGSPSEVYSVDPAGDEELVAVTPAP